MVATTTNESVLEWQQNAFYEFLKINSDSILTKGFFSDQASLRLMATPDQDANIKVCPQAPIRVIYF
jgi:hypothetical protein